MVTQSDINSNPAPNPEVVPNQSKGSIADVQLVQKLLSEGRTARRNFDKDWEKYRAYEKGNQWDKSKRPEYRASIPFNIIRSAIQTQIPILTDSRPTFTLSGKQPNDHKFAEALNDYVESWWRKNEMSLTIVDVLTDTMIPGTGILKVKWNQDLEEGLGDVDVELIDPEDIFVNSMARDFSQAKGCKFVVHKTRRTVGEMKRKFPKKAHLIKTDSDQQSDTLASRTFTGDVTLVSPIDQKPTIEQEPTRPTGKDDDVVEVAECWIFDETVKELKTTAEGKEEKKVFKKVYPNGKLITILTKQNVHLMTTENPYNDGEFPFVRFVNIQKPRQFWGEGEAEPLIEIQQAINKVGNLIMDYMNFTGNPVWMVHQQSGVNVNKLTNQMGLIIQWLGDAFMKPSREIPPPLPAYYFQFFDQLLRFAENITGTQEISQGRRPQGITAAEAMETLQEAAQTRLRLKERNLESSLGRLGRLIISRVMQFVREPRMTKITDKRGWPKYFEFNIVDVANNMVSYTRQDFAVNPKTGQTEQSELIEGEPTKGLFDIEVVSGSSLPFQKQQRGNVAFKLRDIGDIDREGLYDALEYPGKEEILRRMEEKEAEMAELERNLPPEGGQK